MIVDELRLFHAPEFANLILIPAFSGGVTHCKSHLNDALLQHSCVKPQLKTPAKQGAARAVVAQNRPFLTDLSPNHRGLRIELHQLRQDVLSQGIP